jgi:hypothetical protein
MTPTRPHLHDERGLIGKILILWLALFVVLAVVAYDGAEIVIARYRAADAAQTASFEAARTLRETRDRRAALEAAQTVAEDKDVRLVGFTVDAATGQVTIVMTKKASTLVLGNLLFEDLSKATATDTSERQPPG